ncbi:phage tail protein [Providencia rettgeri]
MKKGIIAGAGGGGSKSGSSRTPIEAVDNVESKSLAFILDLLGEGVIGGLKEGGKSVFLDDVPLLNPDGTPNFSGVKIWERKGQQNQEPIEGFDDIETPKAVAVEVKASTPKTIQIDNDEADRVRIIMDFPRLSSTDKSSGDINGAMVEFQFQLAVGDGSFKPVTPVDYKSDIIKVSKKSSGKFQKEYFIDLPKPGKNYRIKVIRLTADSNSDYLANKTILASYGEIIFAKMSYPNSALVGISIDSKEFGNNMPRRSYLVSGMLIRVPSNYDPIDNTYSGDWDGSFDYRVSSNPAWILYDILISDRYGLGKYVKEHMIDVGMLYQIGRYCDEEVSDGFGGKEKRFAINTVIATRQEAFKVINDIASVFRGMVFWAGGIINMRQDRPSDPVMLFSSANIIGRVSRKGSARKDRPTVAVVTYNDKTDLYKQNIEYVEDQDAIKDRGIVKSELLAFGCTSRGQAYRTGLWLLYTAKMETDVILFKAGIDCSMLMPGDVVKLNDKYRSGKRNSGRIVSFTKNSIKLDQSVILSNSGAFISFMSKEGKLIDRNVLEAAGERNVLTFKEPLKTKEEPLEMAVWMVTEPDLEPELVRVISIKDSDEKGTFEITGVAHNPSKYQAIDNGASLIPAKTTINDPTYTKPSGLEVFETTYLSSPGNLSNKLVVTWQGRSTQYTVRYRRSDVVDNWTTVEVLDSQYEILNVSQGAKYDVEVFAISITGRKTETISSTYSVLGKSNPPDAPRDLKAVGDYRQNVLTWVVPTAIDLEKINVYGSKTNKFETAGLLASVPSTTFTHSGLDDNQTWFYWVRAVNKRGMLSPVNSNIGTSATTKEVMSFLKDKITSTELSKDLLAEINDTASEAAVDKVMKDVNESIKDATDIAQDAKNRVEQISSDLDKTVNEKIVAESQKRSEAIQTESKKLSAEIEAETTARELAINAEAANRNTAILNEKKDRGIAISESEKRLQDANQLLANRVSTLSTASDANAAAIKKEEQARTTAVSSEASKRETLAAQMRGDYTGTDLSKVTTGLIFAEREARVGGDKSEAAERKSMETRFNNSLSTVNKSIESVTTAQKAQSGEITAIKNTLNNKADSSAVTSLNTKVEQNKNQITSLGEQTTQLKNNVNSLTSTVNQKADSKALASLQNEVVQHKGLLSSQSNSLTNLENSLQDLRNDSSNLLINGAFTDKLKYWSVTGSNVKPVVDEGEDVVRFDVAKAPELIKQSVYLKKDKAYRISVWVKLSNDFSVPNWGNTKIRLGKMSGEHLGDTGFVAALNKNAWTYVVLERTAQFTGLHEIAIVTNQTKGFALIKNVSVLDAANALAVEANAKAIESVKSDVTKQAGLISSTSNKVTSLENSLNATNGNVNKKADAAALSSLDSKVTQQGKDITSVNSQVTQLSGKITNIESSGSSLFTDSSFANNYSMAAFSSTTDSFRSKSKSVRFKRTTPTNSGGNNDVDIGPVFDVRGGQVLYVECWIRKDPKIAVQPTANSYLRLGVHCNTISGGHEWLSIPHIKFATLTDNWAKYSGYLRLGDTAITASLWLAIPQSNDNPSGISCLIDDVYIVDVTDAYNAKTLADATADAVKTLNTKLTNQDGVIKSHSTDLTNLKNSINTTNANVNKKADSSALTSLDSKVTQQGKDISSHGSSITALNNSTSNIKNDLIDVDLLARITTNGKQLVPNPNFVNGSNNVVVYNNANNGNALIGVIKRNSDNPTSSNYEIQMTAKGAASPNYGGFIQHMESKPNAVFVTKYIIKLPVGWGLEAHSNSLGDGKIDRFVGSSVGTGKYETYYRITKCGATGSFQNGGHVSARIVDSSKAKVPTAAAPMVWYLAQIEVYETTDYASATPEVTNFMSSAKSSLDSLTNTTKSQSTQITNLQNSLNTTNGNVNKKADASAVTALDNKVIQQGKDIVSQAGKLTVLENRITEGDNLIPNPSFSSNGSGWGGTTKTIDGYPAVSSKANYAPSSSQFYVSEGDVLNVSLMMQASVAISTNVGLRFDGPNLTNKTIYDNVQTFKASEKRRFSFEVKVPSGAATARLQMNERGGVEIAIYDVVITRANEYTKKIATAVTALENKVTQQGKDIGSHSSQITNLQNGLNTTNGNVNKKADATALNTLSSKVTAVEGKVNSATSNITSLSSKIDQVKNDLTDLIEVDLDLSKLDVNKYYPVTLQLDTRRRYYFKIFRTLGQYPSNNPSYATHGTKTFSVILEWDVSGDGWGTQPANRMIQNFSYRYTNQSPVLNVSQMTNSSIEVVYLRGGSFYQLTKHKSCNHVIRTDKFTSNSQSVEPIAYNASLEPVTIGAATSKSINDLNTKVTSVEGKLTTTANQVTTLNTAIGKKAESSAVNSLQATVTQHGKDITATNTNVSTLTTKVNGNATKIDQVSKSVNDVSKAQTETKNSMESQFKGQSAKIETLEKTVASGAGLSSTWMVKMEANAKGQKYAAGIALGIEGKNLQSQFLVQADRFALINTANGTTTTPFVIDGGVTYISAASIKNGSIDSAKFGDLQSNNYKANSTGWKLGKNGTLEMNGQTSGKGRLSITNNRIDVYDEKGVLRVRLGLL